MFGIFKKKKIERQEGSFNTLIHLKMEKVISETLEANSTIQLITSIREDKISKSPEYVIPDKGVCNVHCITPTSYLVVQNTGNHLHLVHITGADILITSNKRLKVKSECYITQARLKRLTQVTEDMNYTTDQLLTLLKGGYEVEIPLEPLDFLGVSKRLWEIRNKLGIVFQWEYSEFKKGIKVYNSNEEDLTILRQYLIE